MSEKQVGYTLLCIGLLVMSVVVGIAILTFTGRLKPIPLFNIPAPSFNTGSFMPSIPGLPKGNGQDIQLFPTTAFNTMINLGVEYILMLFLLNFGFKLADLGVKLVRPIKISAEKP